MADVLNQNEIDDLLSSSMTAEDAIEEAVGEETQTKTHTKTKTYSFKEDKNVRFAFPYHSPVVRRENMIFNPTPQSENFSSKTVVRTLDNYVKYLKNKK